MSYLSQSSAFSHTPLRWTLRVLAWLAFIIAAYLAWHSVGGTSVAACGIGSSNGCDIVLSSSWAKWLGIPVAVLGLGCYATLATLSIFLGTPYAQTMQWINTAFVLFAFLAAGASLWFIGVQILAIGSICLFCMIADLCGLAIGGIAIWSAAQWYLNGAPVRSSHASAAGLSALKTALPAASRSVPLVASRGVPAAGMNGGDATLSLPIAAGGAVALLLVLVAGQVILPAKTYTSQDATLDQSMTLAGASSRSANGSGDSSAEGSHVAMRLPSDPIGSNADDSSDRGEKKIVVNADALFPPDSSEASNSSAGNGQPDVDLSADGDDGPEAPINSSHSRTVEFLNGSLKLDVYKHPLLGSPEAPHVMIEMVSYNCPHCRQMHRTIERGLSRYGKQVAVIIMPIPLEMRCNRLVTDPKASHPGACSTARMALGVAAIRPQAFKRFHDWLMADKEKPPREGLIIEQAYRMVDRSRLSSLSSGPDLAQQIKEYVELYARLAQRAGGNNHFGLPVQILGNHIMAGKAEKESDVFDAWEKHLGVSLAK